MLRCASLSSGGTYLFETLSWLHLLLLCTFFPNPFEKKRPVVSAVCVFVCVFVCLFVCLFFVVVGVVVDGIVVCCCC